METPTKPVSAEFRCDTRQLYRCDSQCLTCAKRELVEAKAAAAKARDLEGLIAWLDMRGVASTITRYQRSTVRELIREYAALRGGKDT